MVVNLSGRGDKDMDTAARWFGLVGSEDEPRHDHADAGKPDHPVDPEAALLPVDVRTDRVLDEIRGG